MGLDRWITMIPPGGRLSNMSGTSFSIISLTYIWAWPQCSRQKAMSEFTQEFEQYKQNVDMAEEDAKVYLVLALNQDTLS